MAHIINCPQSKAFKASLFSTAQSLLLTLYPANDLAQFETSALPDTLIFTHTFVYKAMRTNRYVHSCSSFQSFIFTFRFYSSGNTCAVLLPPLMLFNMWFQIPALCVRPGKRGPLDQRQFKQAPKWQPLAQCHHLQGHQQPPHCQDWH